MSRNERIVPHNENTFVLVKPGKKKEEKKDAMKNAASDNKDKTKK